MKITRSTAVNRSTRVMQLEGMFDIPKASESSVSWEVSLPLDKQAWSIGAIIGPSGSGKTTIAGELFPLHKGFDWPADKSILDAFPKGMSVKTIVEALSSVGFSSPPNWLRPFHVLSNGEKFRAEIARAMAEADGVVAIDEFTSVVDRTVAQVGSAAIAKAVRKTKRQFVAVSCHYDIVDWLQPDWIYEPHTETFSRRSLQRRPDIKLEMRKVDREVWRVFKKHHYLSSDLAKGAKCFAGFIKGHPVVFGAVRFLTHPTRPGWMGHRTVCLPDYQGIGIGSAMSDFVASMFTATGRPFRRVVGHPAMIAYLSKSKLWKMTRKPSLNRYTDRRCRHGPNRLTASFEYVGPSDSEAAKGFGIIR